jgi:CheY-like chemotaxis protein
LTPRKGARSMENQGLSVLGSEVLCDKRSVRPRRPAGCFDGRAASVDLASMTLAALASGVIERPQVVIDLGCCSTAAQWAEEVLAVSSVLLLPKRRVRVLLCDDQEVYRAGLRTVLSSKPGIVVVGEAASAGQAVELSQRLVPHFAVVGRDLSGDGLPVVEALSRGGIRVIVLGVESLSESDIVEAIRAGAHGCLTRAASSARLLEMICSSRL